MRKHNLGFATGTVFEHDDGTISFRKPVAMFDSFRARLSEITAVSETKGGKKRLENTLHVFGRGGELFAVSVNAGTAAKLEEWLRAQPSYGGNNTTAAPAASGGSLADELAKLAALRDQGVLSQSEFDTQKRKLLG